MAKKIKFGKVALVIFITILIWVYADLALDDKYPISSATISVSRSASARLWVSFEDQSSSIMIKNLILSGPASKISQFSQELSKGAVSLDFFLVPDKQGINEPGNWPISVASVINDSEQMRKWGLMVESSEPENITVTAARLVQKTLNVKCVDENDGPLTAQKVDPAQVEMWVPDDWVGDAIVKLASEDIRHARSFAVEKVPYIRVGQKSWEARDTVKVSMPADTLKEGTIQNVTLGITYSLIMQGKYRVEIEDEDLPNLIGPISVKATPEARQAYENMRYQLILEIDDSYQSEEPGKILERQLTYNFPPEYVRTGEITVAPTQTPVTAKFKLVPIPSEKSLTVVEE
jgi:hypothetical protein